MSLFAGEEEEATQTGSMAPYPHGSRVSECYQTERSADVVMRYQPSMTPRSATGASYSSHQRSSVQRSVTQPSQSQQQQRIRKPTNACCGCNEVARSKQFDVDLSLLEVLDEEDNTTYNDYSESYSGLDTASQMLLHESSSMPVVPSQTSLTIPATFPPLAHELAGIPLPTPTPSSSSLPGTLLQSAFSPNRLTIHAREAGQKEADIDSVSYTASQTAIRSANRPALMPSLADASGVTTVSASAAGQHVFLDADLQKDRLIAQDRELTQVQRSALERVQKAHAQRLEQEQRSRLVEQTRSSEQVILAMHSKQVVNEAEARLRASQQAQVLAFQQAKAQAEAKAAENLRQAEAIAESQRSEIEAKRAEANAFIMRHAEVQQAEALKMAETERQKAQEEVLRITKAFSPEAMSTTSITAGSEGHFTSQTDMISQSSPGPVVRAELGAVLRSTDAATHPDIEHFKQMQEQAQRSLAEAQMRSSEQLRQSQLRVQQHLQQLRDNMPSIGEEVTPRQNLITSESVTQMEHPGVPPLPQAQVFHETAAAGPLPDDSLPSTFGSEGTPDGSLTETTELDRLPGSLSPDRVPAADPMRVSQQATQQYSTPTHQESVFQREMARQEAVRLEETRMQEVRDGAARAQQDAVKAALQQQQEHYEAQRVEAAKIEAQRLEAHACEAAEAQKIAVASMTAPANAESSMPRYVPDRRETAFQVETNIGSGGHEAIVDEGNTIRVAHHFSTMPVGSPVPLSHVGVGNIDADLRNLHIRQVEHSLNLMTPSPTMSRILPAGSPQTGAVQSGHVQTGPAVVQTGSVASVPLPVSHGLNGPVVTGSVVPGSEISAALQMVAPVTTSTTEEDSSTESSQAAEGSSAATSQLLQAPTMITGPLSPRGHTTLVLSQEGAVPGSAYLSSIQQSLGLDRPQTAPIPISSQQQGAEHFYAIQGQHYAGRTEAGHSVVQQMEGSAKLRSYSQPIEWQRSGQYVGSSSSQELTTVATAAPGLERTSSTVGSQLRSQSQPSRILSTQHFTGEGMIVSQQTVSNNVVAESTQWRSLVEQFGAENVGRDEIGEYVIKKIEIPVVEDRVTQIMKKEIRETTVERKVQQIEFVEKIVEVPQTQIVDKIVDVPHIQDVIVHKPVKQYIDRPVEVLRTVTVPQIVPRIETKEVPGEIVEVPKPFIVERPVVVPKYVDRKVPVVIAQSFFPTVTEAEESDTNCVVDVECKVINFVTVPTEVFVPLPVQRPMVFGNLKVRHKEVFSHLVPDEQYNALVKALNPSLALTNATDLFRFVPIERIASLRGEYCDLQELGLGSLPLTSGLGTLVAQPREDSDVTAALPGCGHSLLTSNAISAAQSTQMSKSFSSFGGPRANSSLHPPTSLMGQSVVNVRPMLPTQAGLMTQSSFLGQAGMNTPTAIGALSSFMTQGPKGEVQMPANWRAIPPTGGESSPFVGGTRRAEVSQSIHFAADAPTPMSTTGLQPPRTEPIMLDMPTHGPDTINMKTYDMILQNSHLLPRALQTTGLHQRALPNELILQHHLRSTSSCFSSDTLKGSAFETASSRRGRPTGSKPAAAAIRTATPADEAHSDSEATIKSADTRSGPVPTPFEETISAVRSAEKSKYRSKSELKNTGRSRKRVSGATSGSVARGTATNGAQTRLDNLLQWARDLERQTSDKTRGGGRRRSSLGTRTAVGEGPVWKVAKKRRD